jgi:hypothetical protein
MLGNSLVSEQLAASQDGLSSMRVSEGCFKATKWPEGEVKPFAYM